MCWASGLCRGAVYSADAEAGLARRSERKSRRGGGKGQGKGTYDELGADLAAALRADDALTISHLLALERRQIEAVPKDRADVEG